MLFHRKQANGPMVSNTQKFTNNLKDTISHVPSTTYVKGTRWHTRHTHVSYASSGETSNNFSSWSFCRTHHSWKVVHRRVIACDPSNGPDVKTLSNTGNTGMVSHRYVSSCVAPVCCGKIVVCDKRDRCGLYRHGDTFVGALLVLVLPVYWGGFFVIWICRYECFHHLW